MIFLAALIAIASANAQTRSYSFRIDTIGDNSYLFVEKITFIQVNGNRVVNEEQVFFDNVDSLVVFADRYKSDTERQRDDAESAYLVLFNRDSMLGVFLAENGVSALAKTKQPALPQRPPAPSQTKKKTKPKGRKPD